MEVEALQEGGAVKDECICLSDDRFDDDPCPVHGGRDPLLPMSATGRLSEEQSDRFIELVTNNQYLRKDAEVKIRWLCPWWQIPYHWLCHQLRNLLHRRAGQ